MPPLEQALDGYVISDDPARLDAAAVHAFLSRSYWSKDIPLEVVRRALANSFSVGAYTTAGAQVGLVRIISDFATYAYLCDVYVLEAHRGRGLSKAMMALVMRHPKLQGLRRWSLVTRDAHGLYRLNGFTPIANADRYMERLDPDVYRRAAVGARDSAS
ncbi:MAG: GNAT family N-acetyltransferase [Opitutae bacterium]|nr:GNAT family N-acetyltransferase [Opitutae bacterium]